jgi:1-acyl-sn-glycerol-3-phosphate acyltransferase
MPGGRERNWIWIVGAPFVRALMALLFRVRIAGAENVPARGPALLAPNHVSVLDGPMLAAVTGTAGGRAVRNIVAAEVFTGFLGWILRQARQIPIHRGVGDTGALDEAVQALRDGTCVGIFPEGRVNDDPGAGLQRIRSGLTRLALPTGAPVIPVGTWGAQRRWPRAGVVRSHWWRRPTLVFVFGAPLVARPVGSESPLAFRQRYLEELEHIVRHARILAGDPA